MSIKKVTTAFGFILTISTFINYYDTCYICHENKLFRVSLQTALSSKVIPKVPSTKVEANQKASK